MKIKEIKQISKEDLEKKLIELKKDLMRYNSQISTSTPPENPGMVKATKKTIAKIITLLKSKEVKTKSNE